MDDTRAVLGGDEVGGEHLERVRPGLLHEEVEQRLVPATRQLGPRDGSGLRPALKLLGIVTEAGLAHVRLLTALLEHGIRHIGTDREGQV